MQLDVGRQIDRYTLEAPIGAGGQGFVYRVRHIQLGTDHALKIVKAAGPRVRERLLQEGRAQARLRHPNIVSVTDVLEVDGDPGLIMEYISGPPLSALLADDALTVEQADLLVTGILDGVAHAHAQRFIHRDLKPDNILCAVTSRGLVPKIMDFGLVKALDPEASSGVRETRSGAMMGTAHYMSPEQIRSTKHVDERSDIWALGVIFYEMLTGTVPFDGPDTFEIFAAVTTGVYKPLAEVRPDLPERMVRAVEAALVIDLDDRLANVEALQALWLDEDPSHLTSPRGRSRSSAWDPEMLTKYATNSLPSVESTGSMNTWAEPAGPARTSGHTLTPGMGAEPPEASPIAPSRAPWLVLALGGVLGLVGLLGLAVVASQWPTTLDPAPEAAVSSADPTPSSPEVALAEEPENPTPDPSVTAVPDPRPEPELPTPEPTRTAAAAPSPTPTTAPVKPAVVPQVAPVPAPAPTPAPRVPAATSGTFTAGGLILGDDSVYLAPTNGGRYIRRDGKLPPGEYQLYFTVKGSSKPVRKTITVEPGQSLHVACDSGSHDCRPKLSGP